ncbi:MAG: gliding motility protein GldM, partial [Bacteroidia bacterium]|nr:gliding motility protein GldM [Bacteroidia bacterium]
MAGGNISPRQKMINLMYLVFISMLALNMSKEVLASFGLMNERFEESNTASTKRNTNFIDLLAGKAADQPEKYEPLKKKADAVDVIATDL